MCWKRGHRFATPNRTDRDSAIRRRHHVTASPTTECRYPLLSAGVRPSEYASTTPRHVPSITHCLHRDASVHEPGKGAPTDGMRRRAGWTRRRLVEIGCSATRRRISIVRISWIDRTRRNHVETAGRSVDVDSPPGRVARRGSRPGVSGSSRRRGWRVSSMRSHAPGGASPAARPRDRSRAAARYPAGRPVSLAGVPLHAEWRRRRARERQPAAGHSDQHEPGRASLAGGHVMSSHH